MQITMETEQSVDKLKTSLPEKKPSQLSNVGWRIKQLVAAAEVLKESLTPEALAIYGESLADLSDDQIRLGIARAIREEEWFPKPAKFRELAGADKADDVRNVEAEAAWKYLNDYLRKWGVDRMPLYSGGKRIEAPSLLSRVDYAVRCIGGLWALNQMTSESRPFMQRDFIQAYNRAPLAESHAPQLAGLFGEKKLLGTVRQLTDGARIDAPVQSSQGAALPANTIERVPESLTREQLRDRAASQKAALANWQSRRTSMDHLNKCVPKPPNEPCPQVVAP